MHATTATLPVTFMRRWSAIQHELIPGIRTEVGPLTPRLEQVIHTLEWVRIEQFVRASWCGLGRPPHERAWLANAFVAKAVLGLKCTAALIERLQVDRALRRICGFAINRKLPSQATFSRAFDEFARTRLTERVHEALIDEHLGDRLIGHLSRDATAIDARERAAAKPVPQVPEVSDEPKRKRGRPRKGEERPPQQPSPQQLQRGQTLAQMLAGIPTQCDRGTKRNAKGHQTSWIGYKLHLDTADCGVPVSALLSSASMHDSRAAIPLSRISAQRVTNLYDLMDSAYCSAELRADSCELGHVPLIDHNKRGGQKIEFAPAEAQRYKERTAAERTNGRLKDEFGADSVMVRGAAKVTSHLMFGVLVLAADQLMRLRC